MCLPVNPLPFASFSSFSIPQGTLEIGDVIEIDVYFNNSFDEYQDAVGVMQTYFKGLTVELGGTILGLPSAGNTVFFGYQMTNRLNLRLTVMSNTTVFCETRLDNVLHPLFSVFAYMAGITPLAGIEFLDKGNVLTIPDHTSTDLDIDYFANITDHAGSVEMYAARVKLNKVRN